MNIKVETNADQIAEIIESRAAALGEDIRKTMRHVMQNWTVKAFQAMRKTYGKTSSLPSLRNWRLVAWLWKGRRELGLGRASSRVAFAKRELSARNSSKGFLTHMVKTAMDAAKAANKNGEATVSSARGIVARALTVKGGATALGGTTAVSEVKAVFKFQKVFTRALKLRNGDSATRRILSAFAAVAPLVVIDTENFIAKQLDRKSKSKKRIL